MAESQDKSFMGMPGFLVDFLSTSRWSWQVGASPSTAIGM